MKYEEIKQKLERLHDRLIRSISSFDKVVVEDELRTLIMHEPKLQTLHKRIENGSISERVEYLLTNLDLIRSKTVFIIKPFFKVGEQYHEQVENGYNEAIEFVTQELGYTPISLDRIPYIGSFPDKIIEEISKCAFVIADLTGERPNCYYEYGLARGLGKPGILVAYNQQAIHSDLRHLNIIFYSIIREYKSKLSSIITHIEKEYL